MNMPANLIRREIEKTGIIPFARFMELALFHPNGGYYETKSNIGKHGDFYTSVAVGELFGQLLAFQFSIWLEKLEATRSAASPNTGEKEQPSTLNLIEAGAHDGRLARDILDWLQIHRPELFSRLTYCIIEPSSRRCDWQKETLKEFAPRVRWLDSPFTAADRKLDGILFSNELLDAFPVRRLGWDARERKWFEWGVALDGEKFVWARIRKPDQDIPSSILHLPPSLSAVLPDGYTIETSPAAESWWRAAANILGNGWLMTIDYGFSGEEMFSPARTNGTLRAYYQHRVSDDVLANAGEQDITAHVNFSAIQQVGEAAGLKTEFYGSQAKFLTDIFALATGKNSFGQWNSKRTRQFQTLTHPEHLGRAFRVLVQSR